VKRRAGAGEYAPFSPIASHSTSLPVGPAGRFRRGPLGPEGGAGPVGVQGAVGPGRPHSCLCLSAAASYVRDRDLIMKVS
jgi:hypothetical protein